MMLIKLTPHLNLTNLPIVQTNITHQDNQLLVSFCIHHHGLNLPKFDERQNHRADFLWEENCLELFLSDERLSPSYVEINLSPDGRHAIYQLDDYRTPDTLPPPSTDKLQVIWKNIQQNQLLDDGLMMDNYEVVITLPDGFYPHHLNPTAILYIDGQPIYYAHQHATPADFHQADCWVNLQNH